MDVPITEKERQKLQKASDIIQIQKLMSEYTMFMSKMNAADIFENLFDVGNPNVSIELAESGGYDGPEHVKLFLKSYDNYLADPSDKHGWMELQHLCTPYVIISKDGKKGMGTWSLLCPSAKMATPLPCDQRKLTAFWYLGKYFVDFILTDKGWKILKLQLISYLSSPFEYGWLRQPDCFRMPILQDISPDREPRYWTYCPDYTCTSGGQEWGPYMPEESEFN